MPDRRRVPKRSSPESRESSESPSRAMTLRSACRGECTEHTPDGSRSGTPTHHHHHHHHHHQDHTEPSRQKQIAKSDTRSGSGDTVVSAVKALNSLSRQSAGLVRRGETKSLIVQEVRSEKHLMTSFSSTRKTVSGSTENFTITSGNNNFSLANSASSRPAINSESRSDRSSYMFSLPVVPVSPYIPAAAATASAETAQVDRYLKRQSKYSDYSSGDDVDIDDNKTDYTYARSSSYASPTSYPTTVNPPNMSRIGLRSISRNYESAGLYKDFASQYDHDRSSGYKKTTESSNFANYGVVAPNIQSVYHMNVVESNRNGRSGNLTSESHKDSFSETKLRNNSNSKVRNQHKLTYGLDYESDDDYDDIHGTSKSNKYSYYSNRTEEISWLTTIVNLVDCAIPVSVFWQKFWDFCYWIICSVILLDAWILSRSRFGKKLLLLLPILLLLLAAVTNLEETDQSHIIETIVQKSSSGSIYALNSASDLISDGWKLAMVPVAYLAAWMKSNNVENSKVPPVEIVKDHRNAEKVIAGDREFLNKKLLAFAALLDALKAEYSSQGSKLASVQDQLKNVLAKSEEQSKTINEIKQSTEATVINVYDKDIKQLHEMHKSVNVLKTDIRDMGDKLIVLQDMQTLLLSNLRNCCRNNTYLEAAIEKQVKAALLGFLAKSASGNDNPETVAFINRLKAEVASQVDVDAKLMAATEKMMKVLNEDVGKRAEAVAKLTADTAVRETIHKQQSRISGNIEISSITEELIKKLVREALIIYDADKTGKTDFALESAGGSVISTRCSETYSTSSAQLSFLGIPLWSLSPSPRTVIQPNVHPGECWPFKGSEGHLVIQLSGVVKPTEFSVEHIPRSLAPNGNIDSAPKDFSIYGLRNERDQDGKLIGEYTYDIEGEPLQYFKVANPDEDAFPIIELHIRSNHGNVDYTCLYRFRVHGILT